MGSGKTGAFGNTYGATLDAISNFLTLASTIPGIDTFADFAAIFVDLARGDPISAGLSALGVIPYVGEAADAAKLAKMADKAVDSAKATRKIVNSIPTSSLTPTHRLTLNKKQFNNLVENIRKNGIVEPIKYVEHNGYKYVVDGHHRLRAAKEIGLDKIPTEKVTLPYKSYKTIKDLEWFD